MYTSGGVPLAQLIRNLPSTLRSLRVMRFDRDAFLFDLDLISSCNPAWSHLTHVTIDVYHSKAALHLLHLAPNLSSLAICISFPKIEALEPFTHAGLQSLRIKGCAPQTQLSNLLDALLLPNLRILEFYNISHWPHQELKAFLARSRCQLESLLLGSKVRTTEGQQAEYAALIPSLEVVVDPSCSGIFGPYEWYVSHL
ncbi:hypothetical protein BDR05DRAFT_1005592 [Suillus weaverae]|nr:hypothetical protein BDR05DRAFT_1005592 [Suillus weaverae]